jgi:hypothetical protein
MLRALAATFSTRKLRLFCCACFEHARRPLTASDHLAWETGLRHADGRAPDHELAALRGYPYWPGHGAVSEAFEVIIAVGDWLEDTRDSDGKYITETSLSTLERERAAEADFGPVHLRQPLPPLRGG